MKGKKESLGLWVHEVESANPWSHIFRDLEKTYFQSNGRD